MKRRINAIQIFYDYDRLENRLPTKEEFEMAYYNQIKKGGKYYYQVKREYLEERE